MKAAVLISRTPEYRHYAPIIEAALARGWEVECWHDDSQEPIGTKGYQVPSIDSVPAFRHGRPVVRGYRGHAELRAWLTEGRVDAVLSASPGAAGGPLRTPRPLWICKQFFIDSFYGSEPDSLLSCDVLALSSRWWLDWAAGLYEAEGLIADRAAYLQAAESRAAFVGLPDMDAAALVDREVVRRRWGIPAGQPVVVLFPFPQGVGRDTFWPKRIAGEPSRVKQLARIVAHRRFEYWPDVRHGWNDRSVVRALRRFCDRHGAYLLVKSRRKTPIPPYVEAVADRCVYDESFYPSTMLEALSIASLSVSYYSNSVFESAWMGVPHLCVTYTAEDYNGARANYFSRYYTRDEGGPFQFRGVSTAWTIAETIARLPSTTLADFSMDAAARSRYVEKFLTHDAGDSGARIVDAVERAFTRSGRSAVGAPA